MEAERRVFTRSQARRIRTIHPDLVDLLLVPERLYTRRVREKQTKKEPRFLYLFRPPSPPPPPPLSPPPPLLPRHNPDSNKRVLRSASRLKHGTLGRVYKKAFLREILISFPTMLWEFIFEFLDSRSRLYAGRTCRCLWDICVRVSPHVINPWTVGVPGVVCSELCIQWFDTTMDPGNAEDWLPFIAFEKMRTKPSTRYSLVSYQKTTPVMKMGSMFRFVGVDHLNKIYVQHKQAHPKIIFRVEPDRVTACSIDSMRDERSVSFRAWRDFAHFIKTSPELAVFHDVFPDNRRLARDFADMIVMVPYWRHEKTAIFCLKGELQGHSSLTWYYGKGSTMDKSIIFHVNRDAFARIYTLPVQPASRFWSLRYDPQTHVSFQPTYIPGEQTRYDQICLWYKYTITLHVGKDIAYTHFFSNKVYFSSPDDFHSIFLPSEWSEEKTTVDMFM